MSSLALSTIVAVGLAAAAISGHYLLQDWAALQAAHGRFEQLAARSVSMEALFVAEARQNVHRLNCFAEGVGVLLGAILAAIGIHGLCVLPARAMEIRDVDK